MALSAFDDRSKPPQDDELAAVLGSMYPLWTGKRQLPRHGAFLAAFVLGDKAVEAACNLTTRVWR